MKVVSGTWKNMVVNADTGLPGTDHKIVQRQAYIDLMEKGLDNWCILQDADEIWDGENLERLIVYMLHADYRTMLFSYQWLHIFGDLHHRIAGGHWDKPRTVGAFRLLRDVVQFNHHLVGVHKKKDVGIGNFSKLDFPGHVILSDVMFFHYGQAQNKEKQEARSRYYFGRDQDFRRGYATWEEYYKGKFLPDWEKRMEQESVLSYNGAHPEAVKLLGELWKK